MIPRPSIQYAYIYLNQGARKGFIKEVLKIYLSRRKKKKHNFFLCGAKKKGQVC